MLSHTNNDFLKSLLYFNQDYIRPRQRKIDNLKADNNTNRDGQVRALTPNTEFFFAYC
jgi:hypothetical protein